MLSLCYSEIYIGAHRPVRPLPQASQQGTLRRPSLAKQVSRVLLRSKKDPLDDFSLQLMGDRPRDLRAVTSCTEAACTLA